MRFPLHSIAMLWLITMLLVQPFAARATHILPPTVTAPGQPTSILEGTNPVFTLTISNPNFVPILLLDVRVQLTSFVGGPDPTDVVRGLEILGGSCHPFAHLMGPKGAAGDSCTEGVRLLTNPRHDTPNPDFGISNIRGIAVALGFGDITPVAGTADFRIQVNDVPEPSMLLICGLGVAGLLGSRKMLMSIARSG